jgi:hypothetical protein
LSERGVPASVGTFVAVNAVCVPASRSAAPMVFVVLFYSGVARAGRLGNSDDGHFAE